MPKKNRLIKEKQSISFMFLKNKKENRLVRRTVVVVFFLHKKESKITYVYSIEIIRSIHCRSNLPYDRSTWEVLTAAWLEVLFDFLTLNHWHINFRITFSAVQKKESEATRSNQKKRRQRQIKAYKKSTQNNHKILW